MESENKGYVLSILNCSSKIKREKIYLKPMAFYVPDVAASAVSDLINDLPGIGIGDKHFILTVTNKNNGVSVDKEFDSLAELNDPAIAADAVKNLVNIVRGYDSDEETNVCGW
ncbi:DUF1869 domain-containing protein [Klebsiella sp. BIGb0407]|uniref:DUF1869 domain-containing protein n=1 Tax=Klebsiella sp. BIGb0407 TaxID=2940603 RepID=UPI0021690979|nr:DUF1869 domain-containing protein [Klebsiella sp. BIGb0407]MCS3432717.1 hypothetical protein [Klebsiella sp. BIGb0407]